jgi:hypothetical protein
MTYQLEGDSVILKYCIVCGEQCHHEGRVCSCVPGVATITDRRLSIAIAALKLIKNSMTHKGVGTDALAASKIANEALEKIIFIRNSEATNV